MFGGEPCCVPSAIPTMAISQPSRTMIADCSDLHAIMSTNFRCWPAAQATIGSRGNAGREARCNPGVKTVRHRTTFAVVLRLFRSPQRIAGRVVFGVQTAAHRPPPHIFSLHLGEQSFDVGGRFESLHAVHYTDACLTLQHGSLVRARASAAIGLDPCLRSAIAGRHQPFWNRLPDQVRQ